jgi:hypothetical protein
MGEVEQPSGLAHRAVLGDVPGVTHRHLPAGEIGERGTELDMDVVQRRETHGGSLA